MELSREEALGVLSQVPEELRALRRHNAALREKLASYERTTRVERVISRMEDGGILDEAEVSQKKVELSKLGDGALDALEQVLPQVAPQVSVGSVATDIALGPDTAHIALDRWILHGEG